MAKKQNKAREDRIIMEIVVDAYCPEERAMGWFCYLENNLTFPFTTHCISQRSISPLKKGDEVEVTGMADSDDCLHEIFVMIRWERKSGLAVPLAQLKPGGDADEATRQAIDDWLYWVRMGYACSLHAATRRIRNRKRREKDWIGPPKKVTLAVCRSIGGIRRKHCQGER